MGDATGGLAPDLGPGALKVSLRVVGVGVLVRLEGARSGLDQCPGDGVVRVGVARIDRRRADHYFCAVGPKKRHLFIGDLVWHGEDAAVAAAGCDDGQADASVARRRLDDGAAGPQETLMFSRFDHGDRRPVLDAATGVEEFKLGQQLTGKVTPNSGRDGPGGCCRSGPVTSRLPGSSGLGR